MSTFHDNEDIIAPKPCKSSLVRQNSSPCQGEVTSRASVGRVIFPFSLRPLRLCAKNSFGCDSSTLSLFVVNPLLFCDFCHFTAFRCSSKVEASYPAVVCLFVANILLFFFFAFFAVNYLNLVPKLLKYQVYSIVN
jgi:hypothetical protein